MKKDGFFCLFGRTSNRFNRSSRVRRDLYLGTPSTGLRPHGHHHGGRNVYWTDSALLGVSALFDGWSFITHEGDGRRPVGHGRKDVGRNSNVGSHPEASMRAHSAATKSEEQGAVATGQGGEDRPASPLERVISSFKHAVTRSRSANENSARHPGPALLERISSPMRHTISTLVTRSSQRRSAPQRSRSSSPWSELRGQGRLGLLIRRRFRPSRPEDKDSFPARVCAETEETAPMTLAAQPVANRSISLSPSRTAACPGSRERRRALREEALAGLPGAYYRPPSRPRSPNSPVSPCFVLRERLSPTELRSAGMEHGRGISIVV
jgi:hypothetical protein